MAAPKVINAINRPFPVTVEVHFDTVMLSDASLIDPDNYTFNRGAYSTSVQQLNEKQVRLTVENLFEFDNFTVTVNENVKGFTGEGVDQNNNSFTFNLSSRPSISDSFQSISSTNGRLKSGTSVISIEEDEDQWYIMTESGLDVIDRVSLMNEGFILDAYGYNAIFVG